MRYIVSSCCCSFDCLRFALFCISSCFFFLLFIFDVFTSLNCTHAQTQNMPWLLALSLSLFELSIHKELICYFIVSNHFFPLVVVTLLRFFDVYLNELTVNSWRSISSKGKIRRKKRYRFDAKQRDREKSVEKFYLKNLYFICLLFHTCIDRPTGSASEYTAWVFKKKQKQPNNEKNDVQFEQPCSIGLRTGGALYGV